MNDRLELLIDRAIPNFADSSGDWRDVVRRASGVAVPEQPGGKSRPTRAKIGRPVKRTLAVSVVALVIGAVVASTPWSGSTDFVGRALAAVGNGPVLHVIVEQEGVEVAGPVVDIASGRTVPRNEQTEIWFDADRGIKKTVTTLGGNVIDEVVDSAAGSFSKYGEVATCDWITAHPAQAANLGVSCGANSKHATGGTSASPVPTLDPALSGFVDNYKTSLASGEAKEKGRGSVGGHSVIWLQIANEQVAIDAATYRPLLIRDSHDHVFNVRLAESIDRQPGLFERPTPLASRPGGTGGSATSSSDVQPAEAIRALGGSAFWLGTVWHGYRLVSTKEYDLSLTYGPQSVVPPSPVVGIEFTYLPIKPDPRTSPARGFSISETQSCTILWGWFCNAFDPSTPGTIGLFGVRNVLRKGDLFVTIWNWNSPQVPAPLDIARALRTVS